MNINPVKLSTVQADYKKNYQSKPNNLLGQSNQLTFGYSLPFKNYKLICFNCGKPMISHKVYKNYVKKINSKTAKEILQILNAYKKYLRPIEKECHTILSEECKKAPNADLQVLLINLAPKHMEKLENIQFKMLNKLDKLSNKLPKEKAEELKKLNQEAREIILKGNSKKEPFKRKIWIENIYELSESLEDKKLADKIYQLAENFPTSNNNVSAFIIKYSRRSPREIAERFLSEAQVSTDHFDAHKNGGASHWTNYISKDRGCNSTEGKMTPYRRARRFPATSGNAQKAMDRIIGLINAGRKRMKGFYEYPKIIADKYRESTKIPNTDKSLINLDISKLKSKEEIEAQIAKNKKRVITQH